MGTCQCLHSSVNEIAEPNVSKFSDAPETQEEPNGFGPAGVEEESAAVRLAPADKAEKGNGQTPPGSKETTKEPELFGEVQKKEEPASDAKENIPPASDAKEPAAQEAPPKPKMDQQWDAYLEKELNAKEQAFFQAKSSSLPRRPSSTGTSYQDYAGKHVRLFDELRSLEAPDGWVFKKNVDTVDIFTKTIPGEDMLYTKGECTMQTFGNGIRHMVCYMLTIEDRPHYDEMCASGVSIENLLPFYRIIHCKLKSPSAIITPRELVLLSRTCIEDNGDLLIAVESVEHPDVPETSAFVRVTAMGGYVIRKTSDPDVFKVSFMMKANPNGWLPGWVKNMVAWKVQLVLASFKAFYEKNHGPKK